jgi:hypothetical protein
MTKERKSRSLRINGKPVKVVSNQMIVDYLDETQVVVSNLLIANQAGNMWDYLNDPFKTAR